MRLGDLYAPVDHDDMVSAPWIQQMLRYQRYHGSQLDLF